MNASLFAPEVPALTAAEMAEEIAICDTMAASGGEDVIPLDQQVVTLRAENARLIRVLKRLGREINAATGGWE